MLFIFDHMLTRKPSALIIFVLLLILSHKAQAQRQVNALADQQWIQYYGQAEFNDHWVILADGGFRWSNYFLIDSQFLMRAALGYTFKNGPTVSAGYAYLGVYRSDVLSGHEHRPYQEIKYGHDIGPFTLGHRLRVEQRFFNINEVRTDNVRYRYALNLKLLSFQLSQNHPALILDFNVGNEIFLTTGNDVLPNAFAQNRFIVSPNLHLNKNLSFAFTWNRQFSATSAEKVFNVANVFWLQIRHNIKLD